MSLSRPVAARNQNPATRFIKCKCGEDKIEKGKEEGTFITIPGHFFEYYEKKEGGGGENHKVDLSAKGFFILECNLMCVTGRNQIGEFSLISNEVRTVDLNGNQLEEILTVNKWEGKTKTHFATGTWKDIKEQVNAEDGNYTTTIYALDDRMELVNFQFSGASVSAWFEFQQKFQSQMQQHWILVKDWKEGKVGKVTYFSPVFELGEEVSEAEYDIGVKKDAELQEYLDAYMKRNAGQKTEEGSETIKKEVAPAFDTKKWREFKDPDGKGLGESSIQEIALLQKHLEDKGKDKGDLYDCVGQALYDYQKLEKSQTWKNTVDRGGKALADYTLPELQKTLELIKSKQPLSEAKLAVEAAISYHEANPPEPEVATPDDDDIPF